MALGSQVVVEVFGSVVSGFGHPVGFALLGGEGVSGSELPLNRFFLRLAVKVFTGLFGSRSWSESKTDPPPMLPAFFVWFVPRS